MTTTRMATVLVLVALAACSGHDGGVDAALSDTAAEQAKAPDASDAVDAAREDAPAPEPADALAESGPEAAEPQPEADAPDAAPDVDPDLPPDPATCPVAVIAVDEGDEVIPQTVLHLHGDQSHAVTGAIANYQWTVEQPSGSSSALIPTATFPNPIFEANVAGTYTFSLTVRDDAGRVSCLPATATVFVTCNCGLHVELLWTTPGDPDPTDEGPDKGANLDLHVAHPYGAGPDVDGDGVPDPWFDPQWDCYCGNPNPDWGSPDPSAPDDPGLDRDDTDGGGPENVNLDVPESDPAWPFVYRVGVHYRDDHGFGPSLATVRVYIYSALVFEASDVLLQPGDLWNVATVEWPSTKVTLQLSATGGYDITPDYPETPTCP